MRTHEFTDEEIKRARDAWKAAQSMAELGELTAQFLECTSPYFPGDLAPATMNETTPLVSSLAKMNRAGFVTVTSQPGYDGEGYDGSNWKQRAYVQGFASGHAARCLRRVTLRSDIVAYAVDSPTNAAWMTVPATQCAGKRTLVVGRPVAPDELDFNDACNATMMEVLRSAYYVCLFDPKWGRKGYLWDQVEQVL